MCCMYLHGVLAAAALSALHEVAAHSQHGLYALRVRRQLRLERLVLLVLRLDVGRVLYSVIYRNILCNFNRFTISYKN